MLSSPPTVFICIFFSNLAYIFFNIMSMCMWSFDEEGINCNGVMAFKLSYFGQCFAI